MIERHDDPNGAEGPAGHGLSARRRLIQAFLAADAAAVTDLLAPDATFHSPVTDYHGPDRIAVILEALAGVLTGARATSVLEGPREAVAGFTAEIEGRPGDGVLRVTAPPDGPATDLTLFVRPLGTLLVGIEQMKALLARG